MSTGVRELLSEKSMTYKIVLSRRSREPAVIVDRI